MRFFLLFIPCVFAASCAQKEEAGNTKTYAQMTMSERINSKQGFKDKKGNWTPEVAGMKLYEDQRESPYFSGDANTPARYQTGDFAKKKWWGGSTYETQAYGGNTDGSRFQTPARDQGTVSREASQTAAIAGPYQTGAYQTGSARETGRTVGTGANTQVEQRRESLPEPEVITGREWQQQRNLDMRTTRGMVGRQ